MSKLRYRQYAVIAIIFGAVLLFVIRFDTAMNFLDRILGIFTPIFLGIVFAFILNRLFSFCQRNLTKLFKNEKTFVKILSLAVTYIIFLGVIALVVSIVIPQLIESIISLKDNIEGYMNNMGTFFVWLHGVTGIEIRVDSVNSYIKNLLTSLINYVPQIFNITKDVVTVLFDIIIGIIFSVYLLADRDRLARQFKHILLAFVPDEKAEKTLDIVFLTNDTFAKFVSGQLTEAIIVTILCYLGMTLFRFEYAILISVLIGFTNLIPIVGAIISFIPSFIILFMTDPMQAVWFAVFIVVLQQIEGNIIYPRVVGNTIGLPSMWVLFSVIVGGGLFGLPGMLLAVPTTCVIYRLVARKTNTKLIEKISR